MCDVPFVENGALNMGKLTFPPEQTTALSTVLTASH